MEGCWIHSRQALHWFCMLHDVKLKIQLLQWAAVTVVLMLYINTCTPGYNMHTMKEVTILMVDNIIAGHIISIRCIGTSSFSRKLLSTALLSWCAYLNILCSSLFIKPWRVVEFTASARVSTALAIPPWVDCSWYWVISYSNFTKVVPFVVQYFQTTKILCGQLNTLCTSCRHFD